MKEYFEKLKLLDFKKNIQKKKMKQISSLYISMILSMIIGIGVSVMNTRLLGPEQYGDLKFLQNLFLFITPFLTIGIFVTGGRLLALKKNELITHQLIGNLFIVSSIISIILIIGFFVFSFIEESIFHNDLGDIIRIFSPLLFVFPFQLCLQKILQGSNKIYELSVFQLSPRIGYLIAAILFNYFVPLSLTSALAIQLIILSITIILIIIHLKPKFYKIKNNFSIIWEENKTFGFHVYIGILLGVASGKLGGLTIGYFLDNINVGYYSLALTTTMPLIMIPNAVGTTFFKDFANRNKIPTKAIIFTLILSISALLLYVLLIKKVILLLYSSEYSPVVPLAYLISLSCIFHGFGDFVNRFIAAHGKGKELRNGAIASGISNILGYIILVYFLGVIGAVITKVISSIIYFGMMVYYYRKLIRTIELDMNMN